MREKTDVSSFIRCVCDLYIRRLKPELFIETGCYLLQFMKIYAVFNVEQIFGWVCVFLFLLT